jgi:hypothetical protein
MNNYFVNIIVNGNSMRESELRMRDRGYVPKFFERRLLSNVDQAVVLFNSINQNWTFPHKTYFIHSRELFPRDKSRLEKLGVTLLKRSSGSKYKALDFASRGASYLEPMKGTHKLILDSDMIALRNPTFDLTKDFLATPGKSMWNKSEWANICRYCAVKLPTAPIVKETKSSNSYIAYYRRTKAKYFPYFNNGAVLVKNEISAEIGKKFIEYRDMLFKKVPHYHGQVAIGLAVNHVTQNWGLLPRGFNYLATQEEYTKLSLQEVTLYHYLGKNGGKNIRRYKRYFNILNETN